MEARLTANLRVPNRNAKVAGEVNRRWTRMNADGGLGEAGRSRGGGASRTPYPYPPVRSRSFSRSGDRSPILFRRRLLRSLGNPSMPWPTPRFGRVRPRRASRSSQPTLGQWRRRTAGNERAFVPALTSPTCLLPWRVAQVERAHCRHQTCVELPTRQGPFAPGTPNRNLNP